MLYYPYMVKQKKKRNKVYRGQDSTRSMPSVIKLEAANRGRLGQWWFERKARVKPLAITAAVVLLLSWLIYELLRAIF